MSRQTDDVQISTRAARERLPARHEPYWRTIEGGIALGYRKGIRSGVWLVRVWEEGTYRKEAIGRADDVIRATLSADEGKASGDGAKVLDFRQAQAKAQEWAARRHRVAAGLEPERSPTPVKPYTVADAMADYIADYVARGGKSLNTTEHSSRVHIVPPLGDIPVGRLTREKLKAWHRALATSPARVRSKPDETKVKDASGDPDALRRRRSSANRVLTLLKAALNHARQEGKVVGGDNAWSAVKAYREVDKAKVRYLLDEEATRLINVCPGDFRNLVSGALLTGCRYGELAAMTAGDFDAQAQTVSIGRSKSGRPRHVALTDEGSKFFEQLVAGRAGKELVFQRNSIANQATRSTAAVTRRVGWSKSDQSRLIRDACTAAKISPPISFHELRHTYASRLAMRGVPMGVIAAQLGHSDTRMTERHYAHLAPSYVADTVRQLFGELGIAIGSNVMPMHPAARR